MLRALTDALAAEGAEVAVLEVADGLLQRETAMLVGSPLFAQRSDALLFAAGDAMRAANGVRELQARGLPVAAVTGLLTRSPLARREAALATALSVLSPAELARPGILERLPCGPAVREPAARACRRSWPAGGAERLGALDAAAVRTRLLEHLLAGPGRGGPARLGRLLRTPST